MPPKRKTDLSSVSPSVRFAKNNQEKHCTKFQRLNRNDLYNVADNLQCALLSPVKNVELSKEQAYTVNSMNPSTSEPDSPWSDIKNEFLPCPLSFSRLEENNTIKIEPDDENDKQESNSDQIHVTEASVIVKEEHKYDDLEEESLGVVGVGVFSGRAEQNGLASNSFLDQVRKRWSKTLNNAATTIGPSLQTVLSPSFGRTSLKKSTLVCPSQLEGEEIAWAAKRAFVFSNIQDAVFTRGIMLLLRSGFYINRLELGHMAFQFAVRHGLVRPLACKYQTAGAFFLDSYLQRHPEVCLPPLPQAGRDTVRYFTLLKGKLMELHLLERPKAIYSVCEYIFPVNRPEVVTSAQRKHSSGKATIIACSNAMGDFIPPFVLFYGRVHLLKYEKEFPEGTRLNVTAKCEPTEESFLCWLRYFQEHRVKGPCVLLVSDNVCHKSLDAMTFCNEHTIHMVCVPLTRLHPLNVEFSKVFIVQYTRRRDEFIKQYGKKVSKFSFSKVLTNVWPDVVAAVNVKKEFLLAGVYPFNDVWFLVDDSNTSVNVNSVENARGQMSQCSTDDET